MTNTLLPRALEGSNAGPGEVNAGTAVYLSTSAPAAVATLLCEPALEEAKLLVLLQLAVSRAAAAARASAAGDPTPRLLLETVPPGRLDMLLPQSPPPWGVGPPDGTRRTPNPCAPQNPRNT